MKPRVYVLLLNWNGWRDTLECLTSLQHLKYDNFSVVVLDNGSTDDSVKRIRESFSSAILIENGQNRGFAAGNNVGIRYALERGGDYVWLLNNDTVVDPDALSTLVAVAESDPRLGAVGSVLYYMTEPDRIQAWGGGQVSLLLGTSSHYTRPVKNEKIGYLTGASILVKRAAIERVGFLDEGFFMYWEDVDYCFRLRKAGWCLAVAPESRVFHKVSSSVGGQSPTRDLLAAVSSVRFFTRHAPVPIVPLIIGIVLRFGKRVLSGQFRRAWAEVRGALGGLVWLGRTR